MNPKQEQFLQAAGSAVTLLHDPAVAAAWDRPSALAKFGVSGLAGHLARQILLVPRLLAQPVPDGAPLSLLDHYAAVPWTGAEPDLDSETNVAARAGGDAEAAVGATALATAAGAATAALAAALPTEPADRLVHLPWGPWSLSLDDFLATRTMEITVHSDDLALSAGVPTPALPQTVTDTVLGLLVTLAARKHGPTAVLRALSRAERAPATIAAF
ncbi:MAG TPA: maleylpyruvate isomerase N-terminal domain-containing protein [Streptosporangiaceae bacterium]|nr:maleylpyruvate isomerase N-terminal domain-containing protein [Streptosporangiaceae bacterium]